MKDQKVSEITVDDLLEYLHDEPSRENMRLLPVLLSAAISHIKSYTGLNDEKIDSHSDMVVAVYMLVQDWYDNRTLYAEGSISPTIQTILDMYSENLL